MKEVQAQRVQQLHQTLPLESNLYSSSTRLANIRGERARARVTKRGQGRRALEKRIVLIQGHFHHSCTSVEKRIGEERGMVERGRRSSFSYL